MPVKRFLSLPVMAVISLMAFVYYITVFVLIEDWVGLQSSPGILNASFFTILAAFCLFSFLVCVLADPGHVPSSYLPDVEGREITDHANGKDSLEQKRCDKCFAYKPPRTHHCRVCRRCILKMDHHCMWINNCVGYWNYKAFFVLALYATIASIHSTAIYISFVLQKDWDSLKGRSLKIYYVPCGLILITLTVTLLTLLGWHIYLVLHNMTTIEYYEGKRAQWLARKSGQSYRHPFNIGAYKNITLVMLIGLDII
ncbi:probable protein S-acyltransferase 15 isoform X2 [Neltuma alba]|uniref:probable protein S-acyltransferase 15 isoform X2 n=1 Tax=Neltuma alba TaxID=207710 RepID=UPI0010A3032E|nr:probable protein S-acyltransferase 15 isoform X2 [Prosopis alba]